MSILQLYYWHLTLIRKITGLSCKTIINYVSKTIIFLLPSIVSNNIFAKNNILFLTHWQLLVKTFCAILGHLGTRASNKTGKLNAVAIPVLLLAQ